MKWLASEYVSFMLVFALGISMVVAITYTMQDLSMNVDETSSEVELNKLLTSIKGLMIGIHSDLITWDGEINYDYNLDMPRLLVSKYYYQISILEKNSSYSLLGTSSGVSLEIEKELFFSTDELTMTGEISSTQSNPYFSFQKNFSNEITLTLGNN